METFYFSVPAGTHVGNDKDYFTVGADVTYYIAAANLEAAQEVAATFAGEMVSLSTTFQFDVSYVDKVLARNAEKDAPAKERGAYSAPEQLMRKLIKKAARDLGSISIDRAVFLVTPDGELKGARIEASEQERRRVIYLDERGPFSDLAPEAIIRAVEEKF